MKTTLIASIFFAFAQLTFAANIDQKLIQSSAIEKLHMLNQAEIKIAKTAEMKACRQDVKRFSFKLDSDHTKTDTALMSLGQSLNLRTPMVAVPDAWEVANFTKIVAAEAEMKLINNCDFDQKFLSAMKSGHLFAIQLTEKEIERLGTTDVVATFLNNQVLPGLRMHYQVIMKLIERPILQD